MTRHAAGTLIVVLIFSASCAPRSAGRAQGVASSGYQLIHPPDVRDDRYPGGFHLQPNAPLTAWHQVAGFATLEECESSRITRIDDSIDEARAEVGDQAKYQLPVRRAVNARCTRTR